MASGSVSASGAASSAAPAACVSRAKTSPSLQKTDGESSFSTAMLTRQLQVLWHVQVSRLTSACFKPAQMVMAVCQQATRQSTSQHSRHLQSYQKHFLLQLHGNARQCVPYLLANGHQICCQLWLWGPLRTRRHASPLLQHLPKRRLQACILGRLLERPLLQSHKAGGKKYARVKQCNSVEQLTSSHVVGTHESQCCLSRFVADTSLQW